MIFVGLNLKSRWNFLVRLWKTMYEVFELVPNHAKCAHRSQQLHFGSDCKQETTISIYYWLDKSTQCTISLGLFHFFSWLMSPSSIRVAYQTISLIGFTNWLYAQWSPINIVIFYLEHIIIILWVWDVANLLMTHCFVCSVHKSLLAGNL